MKKVIIAISGIAVLIIVSLLINKCRHSIKRTIDDEQKNIIETTKKYELEVAASEYGLVSKNDNWLEYVEYINENYVDEKFKKFSDINSVMKFFDKKLWREDADGNFVMLNLISSAKKNVFKYILRPDCDWSDLPITDNLRNKFNEKDGILSYYNLPKDIIGKGKLGTDGDNIYKVVVGENDDKTNYIFYYLLDDRGYFDIIYYLGELSYDPILEGNYNNRFPLNDVESIKNCILEICASENYLLESDDEYLNIKDHYSNMCICCMDDDFRDKVFKNNGILPIKDYMKASLKIDKYDDDKKEAIVKVETNNKVIYYKIVLELFKDEYIESVNYDSIITDYGLYLKDAKVELYKEETK